MKMDPQHWDLAFMGIGFAKWHCACAEYAWNDTRQALNIRRMKLTLHWVYNRYYSFIHSSIHSFIHSFIHPLIHSHSLTPDPGFWWQKGKNIPPKATFSTQTHTGTSLFSFLLVSFACLSRIYRPGESKSNPDLIRIRNTVNIGGTDLGHFAVSDLVVLGDLRDAVLEHGRGLLQEAPVHRIARILAGRRCARLFWC